MHADEFGHPVDDIKDWNLHVLGSNFGWDVVL